MVQHNSLVRETPDGAKSWLREIAKIASGMVQLTDEKRKGTACFGGMGIGDSITYTRTRHVLVSIGIGMCIDNACLSD